jgi:hypothetical protein
MSSYSGEVLTLTPLKGWNSNENQQLTEIYNCK